MKNEKSGISTILIVIIVIIVLIIFFVSFGSVGSKDIVKIPNEFKDSKEEAKRKHKRLSEHVAKQKELKVRLDKKFKRIYFFVRLGLLIIWSGVLFALHFFGVINIFSDALTYSEISILVLMIINFLIFGTITNLKNYIDIIKTKTENWTFGKYISLDSKIEINEKQLALLENEIKENAN